MLDVSGISVFEREQLRSAMIDREHDDRKRAFEGGVLVKIVNNNLGVCVALQLNDHARVLVRFIANGADISQDFFIYEFCNTLHQRGPVHVERDFGDDYLFLTAFNFFHAGFAAHLHAAAACLEILLDAAHAADRATGREIRSLHVLHQVVERDVGIVDLRTDSIDHFTEIVWRNIRRHSNRNARSAVNEKIWKCCRENRRLGPRLVVVRDEIDRVLFHVGHERSTEMRHARLGVAHCRGRIAFDRSEISLAIDQPLAHRPRLGHVHQGRVDHRFAVRMIITTRIAAYFRALPMLPPREER